MRYHLTIFFLFLVIFMASMSGCINDDTPAQQQLEEKSGYVYGRLSWEDDSSVDRSSWSETVFHTIDELKDSYSKATDLNRLCKNYYSLPYDEQKMVIAELFVAMAFYESSWNPTSRYWERTMGIDPVTKKLVHSEGLMQMSYQDTQWAKYCEFDWSKDKYLKADDPKKTIFDPHKNLKCGIRVLANQIERKGKVILSSGVYWAVLKDGGKYSKVNEIIAKVSKLPFCGVKK